MSKSIQIFYERVGKQGVRVSELKKFIHEIVKLETGVLGNINVIFCTDEQLLAINQKFLGHNTLTDVITFDFCEDFDNVSGDIFISIERVKDNAIRLQVDPKYETYRVLFHGVLHLLGYKDKTPEQKLVMRQKEDQYLNLLCCNV